MLSLLIATLVLPASSQDDAARIETIVQKHLREPGAVGLSVAVGRGAEVVFAKGYGRADLEFDVPVNEDTLFRIGSVTKQFTAAAILRLQERGKLAIDDELAKYLPEFPTQGHVVTLRHLLTHTSGIVNYTNLGPDWERIVARELSDAEMLALFQDKPFDFEPGERWNYSNSGYYLLGMIVARVSGQSYGEYLRQEFFEPLGLARTRYDSNGEVIPNRAQGYGFEDGRPWNDRLIGMSQPGGAGGLVSTAKDLVRWQIALVGGKVVEPGSYEEMTLPYMLADGHETGYGFGLGLKPMLGHPCVSHNGGIFGFNSALAYFPEEKLGIAVISNGEALNSDAVLQEIAKGLLAGGAVPSGG